MISTLFDPADELKKQVDERQKKIMAAGRAGSPGKISTLMGYSMLPQQPEQQAQ